jgi:hypothetical protein
MEGRAWPETVESATNHRDVVLSGSLSHKGRGSQKSMTLPSNKPFRPADQYLARGLGLVDRNNGPRPRLDAAVREKTDPSPPPLSKPCPTFESVWGDVDPEPPVEDSGIAMTERLARPMVLVAGVAWLGLVVAGLVLLQAHDATPGQAGEPQARRPGSTLLAIDPDRANLILVAHPRCPCTRASLGELSRILAKCRGAVAAHVLFTVSDASSVAEWRATDLWRLAAEIPGVRVVADEGGAEAARLGVATSGHVLLHDAAGRLLFSGGITASGGHHGDNEGHDAVVALLKHRHPERSTSPVFGCPIISGRGK